MKISTTITRKFFDMKMQDLEREGFFIEYKEDKPFWEKRITSIAKEHKLDAHGFSDGYTEIVFLVGSEPHRFQISNIFYTHKTNIPERYAPATNTEYAYAIKCIPLNPE